MTTILMCVNCFWQGEADELISEPEGSTDFSFCPNCSCADFDEKDEEVED